VLLLGVGVAVEDCEAGSVVQDEEGQVGLTQIGDERLIAHQRPFGLDYVG
jgi:hypothetical protein